MSERGVVYIGTYLGIIIMSVEVTRDTIDKQIGITRGRMKSLAEYQKAHPKFYEAHALHELGYEELLLWDNLRFIPSDEWRTECLTMTLSLTRFAYDSGISYGDTLTTSEKLFKRAHELSRTGEKAWGTSQVANELIGLFRDVMKTAKDEYACHPKREAYEKSRQEEALDAILPRKGKSYRHSRRPIRSR